MIDPVLSLACTLVVAWIFLAAGWHKLRDAVRFGATLGAYGLLPDVLVRPMVRALPVLEIIVASGLLLSSSRTIAAWTGAVLLGIYTLAIGINLVRGRRNFDCGCGDPDQRHSLSEWLLLRNAILIGAALAAGAPAARVAGWLDWAVAVLAAVAAGLIYGACNQLLSNRDLLANLRSSHG